MSQGGAVDLDTSVAYPLKQASAALRAAMEDALRPLGMTITRYSCLELLAQRPGSSSSDLARGAFVTRQSMNVLLQALEHEGLVSRPAQAPVGKVLPVQLTAVGHEHLARASAAVRAVEVRMLADLSPDEQAAALHALRAMTRALQPGPGDASRVLEEDRPS